MKTPKEIKEEAFEWATDYKPWDTDLDYKQYAEYGFEQGYLKAIKDAVKDQYSNLPYAITSLIKTEIYSLERAIDNSYKIEDNFIFYNSLDKSGCREISKRESQNRDRFLGKIEDLERYI